MARNMLNWLSGLLVVAIGIPNLASADAGGRRYGEEHRTVLWWVEPSTGELTEALELPSDGDTSSLGMAWHDGVLWGSHYSSHEGKSSVYLARTTVAGRSANDINKANKTPARETHAWQTLPPMPLPNAGFAAGWVKDRLVAVGGTHWQTGEKSWLDGVWSYEPANRRWAAADSLDQPRAYAAFSANDQGLYLLGGSDGKTTTGDLTLIGEDLKPRKIADTGRPTVYAGSVATNSHFYVVAGGADPADLTTLTDTFFRVDLATRQVEKLPPYPGGPVMIPAVALVGDDVFVFTGAVYDPEAQAVANVASAWAWSISGKRWRRLAPFPAARRGVAACSLDDNRILLVGGYGETEAQGRDSFTHEAWVYLINEDRYQAAPPLPEPIGIAPLLHHEASLYLLGGEDQPRHRSDRFYRWPLR